MAYYQPSSQTPTAYGGFATPLRRSGDGAPSNSNNNNNSTGVNLSATAPQSRSFSRGGRWTATGTNCNEGPSPQTLAPPPRGQFSGSHLLFGASNTAEPENLNYEFGDDGEEQIVLEMESRSSRGSTITRTTVTTTTTTTTVGSPRRKDRRRGRGKALEPRFQPLAKGSGISISFLSASYDCSAFGARDTREGNNTNRKLAKKAPNRSSSSSGREASGSSSAVGRGSSAHKKRGSSRRRREGHYVIQNGEVVLMETPKISPQPSPSVLPVLVALPSSIVDDSGMGEMVEMDTDLLEALVLE